MVLPLTLKFLIRWFSSSFVYQAEAVLKRWICVNHPLWLCVIHL